MHRDGPVTQLSIGAAPGKRPGLRACLMLIAGRRHVVRPRAGGSGARRQAGHRAGQGHRARRICGHAIPAPPATKRWPRSSPTILTPKWPCMHGKIGVTCEGCHGAGKAHVEGGGDITKIFNPAKATPKEVDANCLGCHAGAHPNFDRSPHAKAGVSCISCHRHSRQQGRAAAEGRAARALLPVPQRREAVLRHALPSQGE